jgi:hypothetical protein
MKKISKNRSNTKSYSAHKKYPWQIILILIAIPLTVIAAMFPQSIQSSAQSILQVPPIFFCLATGESNKDLCASSSLKAETALQLNGFELNRNKTVYYNDTLTGSATYTNTGDIPVTIRKVSFVAETKRAGNRLEFNPSRQNVIVPPGKTITVRDTARMFESPNTGGIWNVFSSVTMANGQKYDNSDKTIINVSTACTGLRAIPLTDSDLNNLKNLCTKTPTSKLCTSRQYCELTGGNDCKQPALKQEHLDKLLQCDENIIMPKEEQDMLEELCKEYPGTDTCKDFCARAIDSAICPDGFTIDENVEEPASAQTTNRSVAGAKTMALMNTNCRPGQQTNKNTGECCKYQGPNLPSGQCPRAPGGAAPAPGSMVAPAPRGGEPVQTSCSSGTRNRIGQCCRYSGPLRSTGQCPTAAGGGSPAARIVPVGNRPARACAAGTVRNSAGRCVRSGGGNATKPPATARPGPGQDCRLNGPLCSEGICIAYQGAPAGMGACTTRR